MLFVQPEMRVFVESKAARLAEHPAPAGRLELAAAGAAFVPTGSMTKESGWPASKKTESVDQYPMAASVPRAEPGPTR